jgi:hypothetical protein
MAHKKAQGKVNAKTGGARKSAAQTPGQYARDLKQRQGQYGAAGNPPLTKK